MRIGLRVLSNPQWRGGINYIVNWSAALTALPRSERPEIVLLPFDEAGETLTRDWPVKVDGVAPFSKAGDLGLDFVYPATQIFEAPFGAPWAGWIPDWQCKYLPEMFSPLERARRDLHYGLLAREAPALVLSSQMALEDTRRLIPDMVDAHVLHFPALLSKADQAEMSRIEGLRDRHNLPERYVIVCNQFWRHKNHRVVFEALARVQSQDLVCVMTGEMHDERWPDYAASLQALRNDPRVSVRLRLLGSISRSEQLALMANSVAIIQPSLFEGWSTVVEEARLLGVPLLLSHFPVHLEQNPPASRFFDPQDPTALACLLDKIWARPIDRDRRKHAEKSQMDFSLRCARSFMDAARKAKENYDQKVHDPAVILARLFSSIRKKENIYSHELENYIFTRTFTFLAQSPECIEEFLSICREEGESVYKDAKSLVRKYQLKKLVIGGFDLVKRRLG